MIVGIWHTDHSYDVSPAPCYILSAQQLLTFEGDTHFASMSAAYYAIASGLQVMLSNLRACHSDGSFVNGNNVSINPKQDAFRYPTLNSVIIVHPNIGALCVYVNGDFTENFENWTVDGSTPILSYIYATITKPISTTRVGWEPG